LGEKFVLSGVESLSTLKLPGAKRSTIGLIVDILEVACNGATKTEIVYRANLNFKQVQKFLDFLIKKGLLVTSSNKRKRYMTTEKGKEFINRYKKTIELIL
jgi:predicted transcriptional regulator